MWALAAPLRTAAKASASSLPARSFASSLPRRLEDLPIQEHVTGSSQATSATQVEAQLPAGAEELGQVAQSGADMVHALEHPGEEKRAPRIEEEKEAARAQNAPFWQKAWAEKKAKAERLDSFKDFGSYQTDSNWEPAKALKEPPSAHDVTVSHLMAAAAHFGHHPNLTRPTYQPYLAGRRGGIDIIDVSLTLPSLRKACAIVRDISRDDGVVVFSGRRHLTKNPIWKAVDRLPGIGHAVTERWRPGTLTNAASVFGSEYVLNGSYLPDLVVISDPRGSQTLIAECNLKNVPTMGIVDSDVDPRMVTFPIFANADSHRSLELIFGALGRAGEEGIASRDGLQPGNQFRLRPGQFQAKIDNKRDPDVVAYSDEQAQVWKKMRGLRDAVQKGTSDRPPRPERRG